MENNMNDNGEINNDNEKVVVGPPKKSKRKRHIVRNIILLLIIISLASIGIFTNETVAAVKKTEYKNTTLGDYFGNVNSSCFWSYDSGKELVYVSGDCILNEEKVSFKVYFQMLDNDVSYNSFLIDDEFQSIEVAKAFFDYADLVNEGGL